MSIYYKFKSAKDYNSLDLDAAFISVGNLKQVILQSDLFGSRKNIIPSMNSSTRKDCHLLVTNAQTNEDYTDDSMLIPKNTSVVIRRLPAVATMPIVIAPPEPEEPLFEQVKQEDVQTDERDYFGVDSIMKYIQNSEMDEFSGDLNAPETKPCPVEDASLSRKEEDEKIKSLIESSTLIFSQPANGPCQRVGHGRVMGSYGSDHRTPPEGYVCHRCRFPGHFIQHCPTNGDPEYDFKRVRRPTTGFPIVARLDGAGSVVASVKPDEVTFEKEIGSLKSKRSTDDLSPELRCPLCKEIMKDAVMASRCCFKSFCDRCIRDFIIRKSACICGATNVLADHLVPNMTLRDTINRRSESYSSSGGSVPQVLGNESHGSQPKAPSPAQSEFLKSPQLGNESHGSQPKAPSPAQSEVLKSAQLGETKMEAQAPLKADGEDIEVKAPNATPESAQNDEAAVKSEDALERVNVREPALQGLSTAVSGKEHAKTSDSAKKKKVKKTQMPLNGPGMNWVAPQYFPDQSYMMHMAPAAYDPYWTVPYAGAVPYMGFGQGPFTGVYPQDQYFVPPCPTPFGVPQRNFADPGMRSNVEPFLKSKEGIEATKKDLKRKGEMDTSNQERPRKQAITSVEDKNGSSAVKMKNKSTPWPEEHRHYHHRHEKSSPRHHHCSDRSNGYHNGPTRRSSSSSRYIGGRHEKNDEDDRHSKKRRSSRYDSPPRWSAGERSRDERRRVELEQSVYS